MGEELRRALGGADVSRAGCGNSSAEPCRNRMRSAAHGARWHRITRSTGTGIKAGTFEGSYPVAGFWQTADVLPITQSRGLSSGSGGPITHSPTVCACR